MIVEIKPDALQMERHVTLRLTAASWSHIILQEPEAIYLPSIVSHQWLCQQHSWAHWCSPHGFRQCIVDYGGHRVIGDIGGPLFPTFDGALLKLCVGDVPAQFANVQSWFPHGERVAQTAMHYHVRGTLFFRLVFHLNDHPAVNIEVVYRFLAEPEHLLTVLPPACHGRTFLIQHEPQEDNYGVSHRPTFHFSEYDATFDAVSSPADNSL